MFKKFGKVLTAGALLFILSACSLIAPTPTAPPPTATAAATSTPVYIYVVVTATPDAAKLTAEAASPTPIPATSTPVPTIVYPTATPGAYNEAGTPESATSAIHITSVAFDSSSGKALINWTAAGTFPHGFLILYSQSISNPYYGGFPYFTIADGSARSAYVDVKAGVAYYYRICSSTGSGCDFYSNSYPFTAPAATATP